MRDMASPSEKCKVQNAKWKAATTSPELYRLGGGMGIKEARESFAGFTTLHFSF
jgi:hypothetical protein